ncbi:MAG: TonB-dependent receptor plug domain-containing protein [Flavobacteriia bacterium]|nr:TonB-dependent receptor plug domain-containing protein [Flavobacteriia bacterium]
MFAAFSASKKHLVWMSLLCCFWVNAQQDTTSLKEVVVSATLIKNKLITAPTAVSVVKAAQIQPATAQLSLKEYLGQVPGLFAQNQYNYNQDLRIAIRGFGARAAFGIRGVQIVVDGIPETTPDGQGQLDNVPLGLIENIEVLRGPNGALYGNASGGVVLINTLDSLSGQKLALRAMGGAFGLATHQATLSLKDKKWSSLLYYNQSSADGYREQSGFSQKLFNAKVGFSPNDNHQWVAQFNVTDSPYAKDPGGIALEQALEAPRSAREANLIYQTSEKIRHLKTGLSHRYKWETNTLKSSGSLDSYLFAAKRDFTGLLPFNNGGISAFERDYFGGGSRLSFQRKGTTVMGLGHAQQTDLRSRFNNEEGEKGGLSEQQKESYQNTHVFFSHQRDWAAWMWSGSLRYDNIKMGLVQEGDYNIYRALSPSMTAGYRLSKNEFIGLQYAQSFETPTLSEVANTPQGTLGLNRSLTPSKTKSFELIYRKKKQWGMALLSLELSAFISDTSGGLLPYELEAFPGRQFFNNSGVSERKGIESQWRIQHGIWEWSSSYTWANYLFKTPNNTHIKGNRLPGIPDQQLQSELTIKLPLHAVVKLQYHYVGTLMANNSNSVSVDPYQLINTSVFKDFNMSWGQFRLFAGLNNLTNSRYYDNIRINAFGGRYYEPTPSRNGYFGLELSL